MSLVPAFKIGVWNAWILAIPFILANIVTVLVNKEYYKKISPDAVPPTKLKKNVDDPITLALILALVYSIFIPLKLGTMWFYIGLSICLLGIILFTIAVVNFLVAPLDVSISKGIYRYSRHPQYIAMPLMFLVIFGAGFTRIIGDVAPGVDFIQFMYPGHGNSTYQPCPFLHET